MTTSVQELSISLGSRHTGMGKVNIPEAVAARASRMPDSIAVTAGTKALTYYELDGQANRLAFHLRSLGVGAGALVGLCLSRSLDMVVGALGIMKAGAAYVPMDPDYPSDRLAFMLEDAQAPAVVTSPCLAPRLPPGKHRIINIRAPQIAEQPDFAPRVSIMPGDLAYVIYTSGSTGRPKGVEITHRGLSNLVAWHEQAFSVTSADRASHLAGLGFDAAVWELWPYLASGASVHLTGDITRNSAELLRDWLLANNITISFVPTPLAEQLFALEWPRNSVLRILLTGGDTLHRYPSADLPFVVINNYGPTECTVVATSGPARCDQHPDILPPIGRAVSNTRILLLDENRQPVELGAPGEIYIGGAGLARGYHNRPDLTAEAFIPDSFGDEPDGRLYKTGDIARMLPDGQIVFLGRTDQQIKIRGYRIEPYEIVGALNRHPAIRENLVVAREETPGNKRLVAYLVLRQSRVTPTELREFLRQSLPEYMLPATFVQIDAFPLTAHGKIDRGALPEPDAANTIQDHFSAGPRTPAQTRIAEIVADLLGLEDVSLDDNFFLLGGHSLLGAQLITRLRNAFGVEIALRSLFAAPSVAALAVEVERLASNKQPGGVADATLSCPVLQPSVSL